MAMLSNTPQEFKTTPGLFDTIIHPDDRAAWDRHDHTAPTDGPHERLEFRIVTKEGQTRWISHVCRPVYNDAGESRNGRRNSPDQTKSYIGPRKPQMRPIRPRASSWRR